MNSLAFSSEKSYLPFSQPLYKTTGDSTGMDTHVQDLSLLICAAGREEIYRQKLHITLSQISADLPIAFVFQIGKPTIKYSLAKSEWVNRTLQFCATKQEDLALKEIALAAMNFKSSNNFHALSDDLLSFNLSDLPDIVIIALLRNTFSIRSHILCWHTLKGQAEQLLNERNRDTRVLLRGL